MDTCGLRNGLKLSFVGFECSGCQRHFSSWPLWAIKEKKEQHNISRTPQREKGRRQGKETERRLWPKTKHIPRCAPTKTGSRPLNQRRSVEGAPIKQIFKEGFIHNTSCCYFLPTSGVIDFLQVISPHCFGSLYSAFCCWAPRRFCLFEILLKPAENLTEPFILLPLHWCDVWPNVVYRWICVTSPCDVGRKERGLEAEEVKLIVIDGSII